MLRAAAQWPEIQFAGCSRSLQKRIFEKYVFAKYTFAMDVRSLRLRRPEPFFNRSAELSALARGWAGHGGKLALVFGRRRLGKTYLLQRFFTEPEDVKRCCYYLADQTTPDNQRLSFAERLIESLPARGLTAPEIAVSWNSLLRFAADRASDIPEGERFGLVLDEFPYLAAQSPELPSVLQAWWDNEGIHSRMFVVLCGSQLSFMQALGLESAPLYGRFNAGILRVEPMSYLDCADFYRNSPLYGPLEKLVMYGALGGTPRYHAMVDVGRKWQDELVDLLMRPGAPLESEPRFLLSSENVRDPAPLHSVLGAIAKGKMRHAEIQQATGIESQALTHPLRVLQELRWVRREKPFGETSDSRAIYRIADPFLLFWYRFVAPMASALQFNEPPVVFREFVAPYISDYMGLNVFESVCTQWLMRRAHSELQVTIRDVGRYWSRDGSQEIDIVAELSDGKMLFGECKWSANRPLEVRAYSDLRAKIAALPNRHWADGAKFVLFSLGGFSEGLMRVAESEANLLLVGPDKLF